MNMFLVDLIPSAWTDPETVRAIIAALGIGLPPILIAVFSFIFRLDRKAKAAARTAGHVLAQVQNSHTINLRDDLDHKFDLVLTGLATTNKLIADHAERTTKLEDRLDNIEDTLPRKKD